MLKTTMMGVAVAALAFTAIHTDANAQGIGIDTTLEILEDIGSESEAEQGPSCDWIKRQAQNVGTAYWRNHYREECGGTVAINDGDDDDDDGGDDD